MQRYETSEIPKESMRKILYNTIAHKDYTRADIQMHVYNDYIEVWNEGELPSGYDETVLYGKHSSKPLNRNIAGTMLTLALSIHGDVVSRKLVKDLKRQVCLRPRLRISVVVYRLQLRGQSLYK